VSVERTPHGRWRVRWRENGRSRSKTLARKRDALLLDAELKRRAALGTLASLEAGTETLDRFAEQWWHAHARHLAPSTQRRYAEVWDLHILARLGGYELRSITPKLVAHFRADLESAGLGMPTVLKTLTVLSSVLSLAVVHGEVSSNPVSAVKKPRQGGSRSVKPLPPATVEAIRKRLRLRDATLVSVLAYAGLRPSEALGLRWQAIRERTLLVELGVVLGEERDTKTARARTVRLLGPLAQDLAEWRMASGRPDDRELVFPRVDGQPWRDTDWRNWRRRVFRPAHSGRPYDLRHSFVSLLILEGQSIVEVARQAGHSPAVCLSTYAHVFEEFDPSERRSAEAEIRRARDEYVSPKCHDADATGSVRP
jgi:integrase